MLSTIQGFAHACLHVLVTASRAHAPGHGCQQLMSDAHSGCQLLSSDGRTDAKLPGIHLLDSRAKASPDMQCAARVRKRSNLKLKQVAPAGRTGNETYNV